MIKALIVDDIAELRDSLRTLVTKHCPGIEIVGEAGTIADAENKINELNPDLLFLDIQLDRGTSFDLLAKIISPDFKIIFVTAYNEYALKAFKFSAIDYLLKPVDEEELLVAVKKAQEEIEKEELAEKFNVLVSNLSARQNGPRKIVLRTSEKIYSILISDIVRCESDNNYTAFYLNSGKKLLVSITLKEYEELLSVYNFYRTHQSHLINLSYFDHFSKNDGGFAVMKDGFPVPVSSRKKDEFLSFIEKF